jgi:acetyltransferase-like isoleucine patch superfamily enzyme
VKVDRVVNNLRRPGTPLRSALLSKSHGDDSFWRRQIIADWSSSIDRDDESRLEVEGRLLLGLRDQFGRAGHTLLRMERGSTFSVQGTVSLRPGVSVYVGEGATLSIGDGSYLAHNSEVYCLESIDIGANCAIAWSVQIMDADFHPLSIGGARRPSVAPVHIGDHVWIGSRVVVTKGVSIGTGAVVAAGAVVTKDVAPRTLVGGNPARLLRDDVEWEL